MGTGSRQENASNKRVVLERQRLDKWLWHARVVKARTSAAALVESGHVRVNGVREKSPGHAVKPGDVITIGLDRGVCEPECPADAIKPDTEPGLEKWLEVNTEYAKSWPNITQKKDQPPDAKDFEGMEGKFEKYFSKEPGTGD